MNTRYIWNCFTDFGDAVQWMNGNPEYRLVYSQMVSYEYESGVGTIKARETYVVMELLEAAS